MAGALALGEWTAVVRTVARHDYARALQIARWPFVEVLHAYMDHACRTAIESHRHAVTIWAIGAPWRRKRVEPPQLPEILKPENSDG